MGALDNLADNKGTAVDAAKVFRDSDLSLADLKADGVDVKSAVVRQGLELKKLSDEVFRMVIDGKIPANMAAQIGKHVTDPVKQKQVADLIADGQVSGAREAELLAKTIDTAPILSKTERDLFGTQTTKKSLFAERAKVLANVEKVLKTNKKVFGVLANRSGLIEKAGNVLDKKANLSAKEQADEILFLLDKLVNSKGPVSEALNDATKEYAANPTKANLADVTKGLLEKWQKDLTIENVGKIHTGPPKSDKPGEGELFGGKQAGVLNVEPIQKVHDTFVDMVEPAKTAEKEVGIGPVAAVMRGIHNPDVAEIEFTEAEITGHDKTIGEMRKWFSQFTELENQDFMTAYAGKANSAGAEMLQQAAKERLPEELGNIKTVNAIRQISNFNYAKLQSVVGDDIKKVPDYFYGLWDDSPAEVGAAYAQYYKTTRRFTKKKTIMSVADGINMGLTPKHGNYIDNLKAEYVGIAKLQGVQWIRDEGLRMGKGIFIDETELATPIMTSSVNDSVFDGYRMTPAYAKLINNLIEKNWVTAAGSRPAATLNVLRQINNAIRTVKFAGSAFHLTVIAAQSVADSGYLGFLYKKSALRGLTLGFKKSDPIFKTDFYKNVYVANGGGHRYSIESESERETLAYIEEFNRTASKAVKVGMMPLKIPISAVKWMFESYIPKVKYSKFLDRYNEHSKKLGRPLKDSEIQDIIKENQNFYGMMNERLFGRSGTVTTFLRVPWMSPGYAEGNFKTMLKAFMQWGQTQEASVFKTLPDAQRKLLEGTTEKGFRASESRANIVNGIAMGVMAATVGTLILTGKPPKRPKTLDDMRDLTKIDTGKVDDKGRPIMIDTLTFAKDYWNVVFNLARLRPDKAAEETFKRLGGMTAPTARIMLDGAMMLSGRAIFDYKDDRVLEVTDPFLQKALKLAVHEAKELEPIAASVFQQTRARELDTFIAAISTLAGARPTLTEEDRRIQKIKNNLYSLSGQQKKLEAYLGSINNPRKAIKEYNKTVQGVLDYKFVTEDMRNEWGPKLLIDTERLLENKTSDIASATATPIEIERLKTYLKNFDVTPEQTTKLLRARKKRLRGQRTQPPNPLENKPIVGDMLKERRAKERLKE